MPRSHAKWVAALAVWLTLACVIGYAQGERARITGTVRDATGAVVPGASVQVREINTNVITRTQTNEVGMYYFAALPPGIYELTVKREGFRQARIGDVRLTVNLTATLDVTLEVGTVSDVVEVRAAAVQLEAQSATLGKVVDTRRLVELPLTTRTPGALAALAPSVVPLAGGLNSPSNRESILAAKVAGGQATMNSVLTDGGDSRGMLTGGYLVPIESVAEMKVETSNFASEFGRLAGGLINIATKSGTNELHGSLYHFLRNDNLNANSWGNNRNRVAKSEFKWNQFGASLGGPIRRDRTFFFGNYEGTRQPLQSNVLTTVPTDLQRRGDFTLTRDGQNRPVIVYDPSTTRPDPDRPGKFIRDPFAGNRVPEASFHPISKNVLKYWPAPNRAGEGPAEINNYFTILPYVNNIDSFFGRVDHVLSDNHRLFGRFGGSQEKQAYSGQPNPAFPGRAWAMVGTFPTRSALLSLTSTFSPTLLGEFRVSYTRTQRNEYPVSEGFDIASLGFSSALAGQVRYRQFPSINVSDVAALGNDASQTKRIAPQDNWHAQYHLTKLLSRHKIKGGAEWQLLRINPYSASYSAGQYNFSRQYVQGPDPAQAATNAGHGMAPFLLGIPDGGVWSFVPALMLNMKYYSGYIQDDWRITDRLTLNLGLRYEYLTPVQEKYGQIARFVPDKIEPVTGGRGSVEFMPVNGYLYDPEKRHFAPRVGVAYRVLRNTVVRAAGGITYGSQIPNAFSPLDWGTGLFKEEPVNLGPPNPIPYTPPVGGSWSNPFVTGLPVPDRTQTFAGSNVYLAYKHHPMTYISQWNFSIQQMIGTGLLLEAAYLGNKGTRVMWNRNMNQNNPLLVSLGSALLEVVDNPYYGKIKTGPLSFPTVQRRQLLRPMPHYGNVTQMRAPYGDSSYQAFTLRVGKEYSHGFTISGSYTVSKLITTAPEPFAWAKAPSNTLYDPKYNRSLDVNDIPQRLVLSYIWDAPVGKGRRWLNQGVVGSALGGWQISGITIFQSGTPLTISAPDQTNLLQFGAGRPNRLRKPVLPKNQRTFDKYFDTGAFAIAPPFTIPNDSLTQPNMRRLGRRNFDVGFIKNTPIGEQWRVQFRAEFFNLFNTPFMGAPVTSITSAQFGQITSGGSPREVQLALRITF